MAIIPGLLQRDGGRDGPASLVCTAEYKRLSQTRKKVRTAPSVVFWSLHMHYGVCTGTPKYTSTQTHAYMHMLEKMRSRGGRENMLEGRESSRQAWEALGLSSLLF